VDGFCVPDEPSNCSNNGGDDCSSAYSLGNICLAESPIEIIIEGCGGGWYLMNLVKCGFNRDLAANISLIMSHDQGYELIIYGLNNCSEKIGTYFSMSDLPFHIDVFLLTVPWHDLNQDNIVYIEIREMTDNIENLNWTLTIKVNF
jgi:hypothetical protein